jgi:hypothetical protein
MCVIQSIGVEFLFGFSVVFKFVFHNTNSNSFLGAFIYIYVFLHEKLGAVSCCVIMFLYLELYCFVPFVCGRSQFPRKFVLVVVCLDSCRYEVCDLCYC